MSAPEPTPPAGTALRHTIDLTNAWQPPDAADPTCWTRLFGLPSGLEPGDRVWLAIDDGRGLRLTLNDVSLAMARGSGRRTAEITAEMTAEITAEITAWLEPRNRLVLRPADGETPLPPDPAGGEPSGGKGQASGGLCERKPRATHGRCPLPAAYGRVRLEIEARAVARRPDETSSGA